MLEAHDIYKRYGKNDVLNGASICASPGTITALVGPNGCGKSTLLRIIAGSLSADKAKIKFWGKDADSDKNLFSKYAGFVPQDNPLYEDLSVADNIRFWSGGIDNPDKTVFDDFGLSELTKRRVCELSGGMKRRLAIACMLQRKTPVMLLDEPTSSLDLYFQNCIRDWMKEHTAKNGIVVLSTHNEKEILMADAVYIFNNGKTQRIDKEGIDIEVIKKTFNVL